MEAKVPVSGEERQECSDIQQASEVPDCDVAIKKAKYDEEHAPEDECNPSDSQVALSTVSTLGSDSSEDERILELTGGDDEDQQNDDNASETSSIFSESGTSGPVQWVFQQMNAGIDPKAILAQLIPSDAQVPTDLDEMILWKIIVELLSEPPKRKKLLEFNTIEDAVNLILHSNKIMIVTGAGISVSCGIPDFRSRNGIYARLSQDYPDLPDPQAMFDIHYFRKNPMPFFKFAKEIYPGLFQPSPGHRFIREVEKHERLLRNYTQNIDTLEQTAGIEKVIQCHGSFANASCTRCKHRVDADAIREDIFNQKIPRCPKCPAECEEMCVMKPDIVFFGEGLAQEFHATLEQDQKDCDLLIVIGSSLKVRPVALIPSMVPVEVPQILINREPLRHMNFDIELLGDCDVIISELCLRLGADWAELVCPSAQRLSEVRDLPLFGDEDSCAERQQEVPPEEKLSEEKPAEEKLPEEKLPEGKPAEEKLPQETPAEEKRPERVMPTEPSEIAASSSQPAENSVPQQSQPAKRCREAVVIDTFLPENSFIFVPPNRYIFHGAEVYPSDFKESSSSSSSGGSTQDDDENGNGNEERDEDEGLVALRDDIDTGVQRNTIEEGNDDHRDEEEEN